MQPGLLPTVIAVGVDGSLESTRALTWALALANALGARLIAVHGTGLLEGAGMQPPADLENELEEALRTLGTDGKRLVGESQPDQPAAELIRRPGHPVDVLLSVADDLHADLLVVGRRGIGLKPAGLGSTSEAVLQAAAMPVVVFPPEA